MKNKKIKKNNKKIEQKKMIEKLFNEYTLTKFVSENIDKESDIYFVLVDGFMIPIKKEVVENYIQNKIDKLEEALGINKNTSEDEKDEKCD